MRFLLSMAVLAATCTGFAQGTTDAPAIHSYSNSVLAGGVTTTVGWTFQVATSEQVTQLGCFTNVFAYNPAVNAIQVGLWNGSGSLLASN